MKVGIFTYTVANFIGMWSVVADTLEQKTDICIYNSKVYYTAGNLL